MKPTTFASARLWLLLLFAGLTFGLVSWDHQQAPGRYGQAINDTVPKTKTDRDKKIRDLDDVIDELNSVDIKEALEKAQKEFAEAMKQFDGDKFRLEFEKVMKDVDFEKIMKEATEAMKQFDGDKIRLEFEKVMKDVDFEKIMKEARESMSKVEFDKVRQEFEEAMKEIDMTKIQAEIKESMKDIDMDKLKEELEKVRKIDMKEIEEEMKKVREELSEMKPRIEKEMEKAKVELEKAKVEIEKAKVEFKELKEFVDGLDKDGLINKKESYIIKHKDGELIINGKKASDQVYNKYRLFLEKHKKFSIDKSDDDFNVDMD